MLAAEKLIANRGIENVSIRDIVAAGGQRNESALQYHFKNLSGLISEIHRIRSQQIQERRAGLIRSLSKQSPTLDIADLCKLLIQPAFELASESDEFQNYVRAFGHKLMLAQGSPSALAISYGGGGASGLQTATMLKEALPHLDSEAYQQRMDAAVLLCSASMHRQSHQFNPFSGEQAQLFMHHLIDVLIGIFSAPVSPEAQILTDKLGR
jgi:AcrR family transcriptional regulator